MDVHFSALGAARMHETTDNADHSSQNEKARHMAGLFAIDE
jgi:hypothetical protein